ncbi:MAG: sigma-70 family RNA polymerase sigma factor [Flavobacteriales bacterium]|nr:sigma-70 family RNA polymerase sigma factor [Flavobacteriales bacterium]
MANECCNINDTVQEFYDYLKAFLYKRVSSNELAEDIVQDVMLELVKAHQKRQEVSNMKAWLFQVTRNTLSKHFKNNPNLIQEDWDAEFEFEDNFSKVVTEDYIIPMIGLLPKEYGEPLLMSDIKNIPQKEIAETLNLSLTNTKARIQRGRKKLRDLFTECCHLEFDRNGDFIGCTIKDSCEPLHEISKKIQP